MTEEDEAFDDLAKRQGDWGGGFPAKRAMAKARVEEDDDIQDYKKPWVGLTDEERNAITSEVIGFNSCVGWEEDYARAIEQRLKEKNT